MRVIGIGLLVPALPLSLERKCLLHLSASHMGLAAALPSEICLALFKSVVYGHSVTVLLLLSGAKFAWRSAGSFLGLLECRGTQWISVVMLWVRRLPPTVDTSCQSLPWARHQVCRLSNCSLWVTDDCHRLHYMHHQSFCLLNRHVKHESNCPPIGVNDLRLFSAQLAAAGPPLISVHAYCCGSHSAVIWTRSIYPPRPDSCYHIGCCLAFPARRGSLGCGGVIQYDGFDDWFFAWGRPVHAFSWPAMLVLFLHRSTYRRHGRGVLVLLP